MRELFLLAVVVLRKPDVAQKIVQNHLGIERLIEGLTWNGEQGYGVSFLSTRLATALTCQCERRTSLHKNGTSTVNVRVVGQQRGTLLTSKLLTHLIWCVVTCLLLYGAA